MLLHCPWPDSAGPLSTNTMQVTRLHTSSAQLIPELGALKDLKELCLEGLCAGDLSLEHVDRLADTPSLARYAHHVHSYTTLYLLLRGGGRAASRDRAAGVCVCAAGVEGLEEALAVVGLMECAWWMRLVRQFLLVARAARYIHDFAVFPPPAGCGLCASAWPTRSRSAGACRCGLVRWRACVRACMH